MLFNSFTLSSQLLLSRLQQTVLCDSYTLSLYVMARHHFLAIYTIVQRTLQHLEFIDGLQRVIPKEIQECNAPPLECFIATGCDDVPGVQIYTVMGSTMFVPSSKVPFYIAIILQVDRQRALEDKQFETRSDCHQWTFRARHQYIRPLYIG
jgi:hypothetical protein